jgi:hypothetical protein
MLSFDTTVDKADHTWQDWRAGYTLRPTMAEKFVVLRTAKSSTELLTIGR